MSAFTGAQLRPVSGIQTAGARRSLHVQAGLADLVPKPGIDRPMSKRDKNTVQRGKQGETRKQGKQVPKKGGSYVEDYKPKQAGIFSNARNAPREKGFGGGGPWQKIDPKTPGFRGITDSIDPLVYTAGLIVVFVGAALALTAAA